MAALREYAITKISTTASVNMQTAASTALFVVPAGKTLYVDHVVVRNVATNALTGGSSYGVTGWRSGINLATMTVSTTIYRKLLSIDNTDYTSVAAGATLYWIVTTGSTNPATATIEVFGYLV